MTNKHLFSRPKNPCNSWLIKDLRAYKAIYICRETFTDVMSALQIRLFMQNKANFRKVKLNVNKVLTGDYEKRTLSERGEKQSQTKPIKANLQNTQMNVTVSYTTNYENNAISGPGKTNPIQTQTNPTCSELVEPISKAKNADALAINGREVVDNEI
ncbi:MAG: hypothetical protein WBC22_02305 [Sedimentisphaerales bacterium]